MGHISLPVLSRLLGVPARLIASAHSKGFLPEPPTVSGRRVYDLGEVVRVAEYFGAMVPTQSTTTTRRRSKQG